eukprot:2529004-Rhodomonas_salina.3
MPATALRARYANPGAETGMLVPGRHLRHPAHSEQRFSSWRRPRGSKRRLASYARAMRCPVLTDAA